MGLETRVMPVRKVKGGYRWGSSGKTYKSKAKAATGEGEGRSRRRRKKALIFLTTAPMTPASAAIFTP